MELIEFLRARLDEDFEAVRLVLGVNVMAAIRHGEPAPRWVPSPKSDAGIWDTNGVPRVKFVWARERDHIARHDPARVLAEIEAKREVLRQYEHLKYDVMPDDLTGVWAIEAIMRAQARPYRDHPDFDPAWLED